MKNMRFTVVIVFLTTLILLVDLVYCGHPENTSPENDHIVEWDGVIISDRVEGYISTENGHYDEVDGEDFQDQELLSISCRCMSSELSKSIDDPVNDEVNCKC